jgi:hypothetical protein
LVSLRAAGASPLEPCLVDSSRRAGIRNRNRKRSSAAPSWGCYARSKKGHHPLCGNRDDSRLRPDWGRFGLPTADQSVAGVGRVEMWRSGCRSNISVAAPHMGVIRSRGFVPPFSPFVSDPKSGLRPKISPVFLPVFHSLDAKKDAFRCIEPIVPGSTLLILASGQFRLENAEHGERQEASAGHQGDLVG